MAVSLLATATGRAGSVVTVNHLDNGAAGADFQFQTVPVPRRTAAIPATFSLVDGSPDPHGGSLDILHDGELPSKEDEPGGNFFFTGTGGRWLVDLGKTLPVREVDTYSRHSGVRAPQVYKLYGSDGSAAGFNAHPARPQDPARTGWKLLATVDTRTQFGMSGGQYGVSVVEPGLPGRYRYLLFDTACTETADGDGNTFYSEVAVVDGDAAANPPLAVLKTQTSSYDENGLHLVFTNDDPKFDPAVQDKLVKTFFTVYPLLMKEFNPSATRSVRISVETRYHGLAATAGGIVHINPRWLHSQPKDTDLLTHEAMHIVQDYGRGGVPGWLCEGLADYARYRFGVDNAGGGWTLPNYAPDNKYTDSYRVTARFLVWLDKHVKPGLGVTLDRISREGKYTPETWKQQTGKSVDELWQDYSKNPAL